ncbi:MAG: glycine dehydrogenase subunit 2 [Chloroflexi bacterium]|nr:MAG: glycine dehydrogenase subunit 2 [Chloroflexota bacterium]
MTTVTGGGVPVQRAKRASQTIPDSGADTHGPALEPLLFELARPGRSGRHVRAEKTGDVPAKFARKTPLRLPELTEPQVVRHYTHLAQLNYSVDAGMYPLGSCTMKYNPKINDRAAALFADLHPRQSYRMTQGVLALAYELEQLLLKVTGMDFVTLQPQAGAQSEFTALLMFKAYHQKRGDAATRRRIIVPDSAHGTNPASAAMCGYKVTTVKSDARGNVDLEALKSALGPDVAGFMLTNPNTIGLFEERVREVCDAVHAVGALVYGDGANMNALLGIARPGDLGFDCVHINVHKTFSTPHGAGGPGAGPLCVKAHLRSFLPKPWIVKEADGSYHYDTAREDREPERLGDSIGKIGKTLGNFGVLARAYTYMKTLGEEGLVETGRDAVLAANYLLALLRGKYDVAYDRPCMHEFVLTAARQKKQGSSALDISKALLDEGFHSPTVYFPLIVPEALMIEPTETEPKETLDAFAAAMIRIAERIEKDPAAVHEAPTKTPLRRLDEVGAARKPVLRYRPA